MSVKENRNNKKLVVYVHGKGGNATEAEHYKALFAGCDVVGFDYKSENPWEAKTEFAEYFAEKRAEYSDITLIANSIGAFFAMNSLTSKEVERALFISPVVDMEKLICDMMSWAKVTDEELKNRKEIPTTFGETLSWQYLCYVREHSLVWNVPTCILYGSRDNLTSIETIADFAERTGAKLTVAENAEHWFHTDEQVKVLDEWIASCVK